MKSTKKNFSITTCKTVICDECNQDTAMHEYLPVSERVMHKVFCDISMKRTHYFCHVLNVKHLSTNKILNLIIIHSCSRTRVSQFQIPPIKFASNLIIGNINLNILCYSNKLIFELPKVTLLTNRIF